MSEIIINSDHSSSRAFSIVVDALKVEENRLGYALQLGQKKLNKFEEKYGVSSETFLKEWTAEQLAGKDLEYVEWAGEVKLASRIQERLAIIKGLDCVNQ
jgi:hypothetical protein